MPTLQRIGPLRQALHRPAPQCTRSFRPQLAAPSCQRRHRHSVPTLRNEDVMKKDGIPDLLTPVGFDVAWTQYQAFLIDKLNEKVAEQEYESTEIKPLIVQFARDPQKASLFNHASMAWNNHFFFNGLSIEPKPQQPSSALIGPLERDFSSLSSLKETFIATALAMFGPGFVWLVRTPPLNNAHQPSFHILTTYLAGSPLSGAHYRQQNLDMNAQNMQSLGGVGVPQGANANQAGLGPNKGMGGSGLNPQLTVVQNTAGSFGAHAPLPKGTVPVAPGGADTTPLLCVNTWQHVWLFDWGIAGKEDFLRNWWERIDWERVEQLSEVGNVGRSNFYGTG